MCLFLQNCLLIGQFLGRCNDLVTGLKTILLLEIMEVFDFVFSYQYTTQQAFGYNRFGFAQTPLGQHLSEGLRFCSVKKITVQNLPFEFKFYILYSIHSRILFNSQSDEKSFMTISYLTVLCNNYLKFHYTNFFVFF